MKGFCSLRSGFGYAPLRDIFRRPLSTSQVRYRGKKKRRLRVANPRLTDEQLTDEQLHLTLSLVDEVSEQLLLARGLVSEVRRELNVALRRPYEAHAKKAAKATPESLRTLMRQVPHPVVVVTALESPHGEHPVQEQRIPVPVAMTLSSFTSLAIRPTPMVTFNASLPSRTYSAVQSCRAFNIHILSGDHSGARLADRFTRGNNSPMRSEELGILAGLEEIGVRVEGRDEWLLEWNDAHRKAKAEYSRKHPSSPLAAYPKIRHWYRTYPESPPQDAPPRRTLPLLQGEGIMYVLKCTLDKSLTIAADTHAIVVGRVDEVLSGATGDRKQPALAYMDGEYQTIDENASTRDTTPSTDIADIKA
ncbi:flavin reductase like domain-containing protein [Xylariomycetidae sp. FL2044]|nr:flavin reductase like domain-containing protein [Xylariomycetidae sp. FL2044]